MPFPGGVSLFVEIVQVLAGPEGIGISDFNAAATHVERFRDGGVGLQFDGMGACLGCGSIPMWGGDKVNEFNHARQELIKERIVI